MGYWFATDALGESYQLKPVRSNPGLAMKAHPDARPVSPVFCWVVCLKKLQMSHVWFVKLVMSQRMLHLCIFVLRVVMTV